MEAKVVDTRADTEVDEATAANDADFAQTNLPVGLNILTPEEVEAAEEAAPETSTVEEQAALIAEMKKAAEKQDAEITEALSQIGTYMLIRFENPTSMRAILKLSEPRPQDRTMIAVLERMVREFKVYEARSWTELADKADAEAKEEATETTITREILTRGLPNNRATRRRLAQELGLS